MIFIKKHFPFLVLFLLLFSCTKQEKKGTEATDLYADYIAKGSAKMSLNEHDSAFYYFNQAKLVCKKDDDKSIVYALLMMGRLQNNLADYAGLESTMTEALKVVKDSTYYPYIYNLLGIAYKEQYDYDSALLYYTKSLKIASDDYARALVKNNIALLAGRKDTYPEAIGILEPLTKIDTLRQNRLGYAKIVDNLGYSYYKNNDSRGLENLQVGLAIRDSLGDDYERVPSLLHLAEFYQKNDSKLALAYSLKAYKAATAVNSPEDRLLSLDFIIKNSSGDADKKYYLIHSSLSDSITKVRKIAKNQFAKIKYDSKKITIENEKNKNSKIALFIVLLAVIAAFIIYYFIANYRNKQKLRAATYETETRISKRLHDELANDVYNAITYAETQDLNDEYKKENLLESLDQIYSRTRNISKENSTIATDVAFEYQLKEMLSSYNSTKTNVIINNLQTIDWSKIKKEPKIAIYRVLQELMVNMKKHSKSTHVFIGFENQKKTLHIKYSDNGKGCSDLLKNKKGLQNAENRILAINGTLTFETETGKGFKVEMIVPN